MSTGQKVVICAREGNRRSVIARHWPCARLCLWLSGRMLRLHWFNCCTTCCTTKMVQPVVQQIPPATNSKQIEPIVSVAIR